MVGTAHQRTFHVGDERAWQARRARYKARNMSVAPLIVLNSATTMTDDQLEQGTRAGKSAQLQTAISRWENEGGANGDQLPAQARTGEAQTAVDLTNAELVQLQVRVIALENLLIALLAGARSQTPDLARALACSISPRPGFTPHHLTLHAAVQMNHLVNRSVLFQDTPG